MGSRLRRGNGAGGEGGFALLLALLTLVVLTFLGLTLALTTSTELQIATNYRWSQQAFYNAEAGVELAKRILREVDWDLLVPPPRTTPDNMKYDPAVRQSRNGPSGEPSRNLEMKQCDTLASGGSNQGYGAVLDNPSLPFPLQNVSTFLGRTLAGSFTVWIRRPPHNVAPNLASAGAVIDYDPKYVTAANHQCEGRDCVVVTAEGTAPFQAAAAATQFARARRAVRIVEVILERVDPSRCNENRAGQTGGGPSGSGYNPCEIVRPEGVPGAVGEPDAAKQ